MLVVVADEWQRVFRATSDNSFETKSLARKRALVEDPRSGWVRSFQRNVVRKPVVREICFTRP
jgi:hypothetical protein